MMTCDTEKVAKAVKGMGLHTTSEPRFHSHFRNCPFLPEQLIRSFRITAHIVCFTSALLQLHTCAGSCNQAWREKILPALPLSFTSVRTCSLEDFCGAPCPAHMLPRVVWTSLGKHSPVCRPVPFDVSLHLQIFLLLFRTSSGSPVRPGHEIILLPFTLG